MSKFLTNNAESGIVNRYKHEMDFEEKLTRTLYLRTLNYGKFIHMPSTFGTPENYRLGTRTKFAQIMNQKINGKV